MKTEIAQATVKGLAYKAGTKETDPASIGRLVIEFDADGGDAAEIAAMIGQTVIVAIETPQLAMLIDRSTGEVVGAR